MKKTQLLLILLITLNGFMFAQSTVSFETIAQKKINIDPNNSTELAQLKTNINSFIGHGVDALDIEIFYTSPLFMQLKVTLSTDPDNTITYQDLLNQLLEAKQLDFYPRIRKATKAAKEIEKRPANIKNWDQDKQLLKDLEMPEDIMASFKIYLKEHSNPNRTYRDVLTEFSEQLTANTEDDFESLFKHRGPLNIDNLISKSLETNKPILLYFTGYACVNSRKMEDNVLRQKEILSKLKNDFIFKHAYLDSKLELPKDQWFTSKTTGIEIRTIGQLNSDFQIEYFQKNSQPFFAIINAKKETLNTTHYTRDVNTFLAFLRQGLSKF